MTSYENLDMRIRYVNDNLVLKDDYSEELERLYGIESDISVCWYLNELRPWEASSLRKRARKIIDWIKQEQAVG